MFPPPCPQRQPELPHMPEEAAGRTLKIRLSGHHPQKKSGVGEEPGRKGRPNKCPGAVVWEEFCCVMWRSCQSFLEGWGLSGVAEEWSSNLKSPGGQDIR